MIAYGNERKTRNFQNSGVILGHNMIKVILPILFLI